MQLNQSYSIETIQKVCSEVECSNLPQNLVARMYNIPESTVSNWCRAYRLNGNQVPPRKKHVGKPPKLTPEDADRLKSWLDEEPHLTCRALRAKLIEETGKTVSEETIRKCTIGFHNTLGEKALKLKSKDVEKLKSWLYEQPQLPCKALQERLFAEIGKTVSEDTIRKYTIGFYYTIKRISVPSPNLDLPKQLLKEFACWFLDHVACDDAVDKLLFVNDTGFGIEMRTNFGRSLNGDLIRIRGPKCGSRHYTSICALGCDYVPHSKMQEGSVNTADMLLFLNDLFDKLPSVGYTLIMDNVRFQRTNEVQDVIRQRGYSLKFLPRYLPFLDAIEVSFNEWRDKVRSKNPKDEVELVSLIDEVNISPEICHNYFLHIQETCQKILAEEEIFNNDRN